MTLPLIILRPQPGADATAALARERSLRTVVAPLFVVKPMSWQAPDPAAYDAVLLTSANAARHAGDGLRAFLSLPCYVVGPATAALARDIGFLDLREGPGDAADLMTMIAGDGVESAFHPCGRDRVALPDGRVRIASVAVYASEAVDRLPEGAREALRARAVALIHSPRAGSLFASVVRGERHRISIAAISAAAAGAAGVGWERRESAAEPREEALLELAAKLCQTDGND